MDGPLILQIVLVPFLKKASDATSKPFALPPFKLVFYIFLTALNINKNNLNITLPLKRVKLRTFRFT